MNKPRVIISAILEKIDKGERKIFFQTRWKPKSSPSFSGLFEIPAGGVNSYEDIYESVCREVKEETGLDVTGFIDSYQSNITENIPGNKAKVFLPFICQQVLETKGGIPWIGFVFRCKVKGKIDMNINEAKDPQWLTIKELTNLVKKNPEKIFPLQFPVIKYYLENS